MTLPKALAQGIAAIAVKRGLFKQTVGWVDIDQSPNTQGHSPKPYFCFNISAKLAPTKAAPPCAHPPSTGIMAPLI